MIMKQIFTMKWQKSLCAMALCLTALPVAQAVYAPVFAADIGKSDRMADPQAGFDNSRYSSSSDWKSMPGWILPTGKSRSLSAPPMPRNMRGRTSWRPAPCRWSPSPMGTC